MGLESLEVDRTDLNTLNLNPMRGLWDRLARVLGNIPGRSAASTAIVVFQVGMVLSIPTSIHAVPDTLATDRMVSVEATFTESPPTITLRWDQPQPSTGVFISRKLKNDTVWDDTIATLSGSATIFQDTDVVAGTGYEYKVWTNPVQEGYVYAGIRLPMVEDRGIVLVVVDNTQSASLEMELERLRNDLVGDGWEVLWEEVSPSDSVVDVKSLIVGHYNSDPARMNSVLLLGDIPVPYSGNFAPDGHSNHVGAWPADCFYADMDGSWTDVTVNNTAASSSRNDNVPGDGKYDQNIIASDPELMVGRVDLSRMTLFTQSETELLRQYLDKDHQFRHKKITVPSRALVRDGFLSRSEGFAQSGWRIASLVGIDNVTAGSWGDLIAENYLWAYGCGSGTYTSAGSVTNTQGYADNTYQAVFQMLFGSYFGDWDTTNNFLRAPLCNPDYGLTSCWAGRPNFQFHHMGMGETIGFGANLSLHFPPYIMGSRVRGAHVALMGDPTLRLHPVSPPGNVEVVPGSDEATLTWLASLETVEGYHVYRSDSMEGPFQRLTTSPVSGTSYTDSSPPAGDNVYMIRSLKLEVSATGSYYNLSQGVFSEEIIATGEVPLSVVAWDLYR